ncbi:MAG: hypothetical protein M1823_005267 [Watsoniomyces obsoletus]|nr:MAG: hypothetical protein M1823_005267 [Watsoniomyces obsoletus]
MTQDQAKWTALDDYFNSHLLPTDPILSSTLTRNAEHGLPPHDVSPAQGKFLYLLTLLINARRVLEIGTLGGYSNIWFARAIAKNITVAASSSSSSSSSGGDMKTPGMMKVVTLETNAAHADVARQNIADAKLSELVEIRVADARESLAKLDDEGKGGDGHFDLIFIDADKQNNPAYLAWALKLSKQGTLIIADNVVRDGAVLDDNSTDGRVQGIRSFVEMVAQEPRLEATAMQTVGGKGHDGFIMALVVS